MLHYSLFNLHSGHPYVFHFAMAAVDDIHSIFHLAVEGDKLVSRSSLVLDIGFFPCVLTYLAITSRDFYWLSIQCILSGRDHVKDFLLYPFLSVG